MCNYCVQLENNDAVTLFDLIQLKHKGKFPLFTAIDSDWFPRVKNFNWRLSNFDYVFRTKTKQELIEGQEPKEIRLSRLIANCENSKHHTHHKNKNLLDNRKDNLIAVTQREHGRLTEELNRHPPESLTTEQMSMKLVIEYLSFQFPELVQIDFHNAEHAYNQVKCILETILLK